MAPLPPNSTARYKVFYTVGGHQHTQEVRANSVSPATFGTELGNYYAAITSKIYATVIDQVQFAGTGLNIFNAVTTGQEGATYGSGTFSVAGENAYYYDFVGRTSGGRRVRFAQFGAKGLGGDYRFVAGEDAALDAARAVLVAATNLWFGIDNLKPIWKSYINAGVNAYWQRHLRP